MRTYKIDSANDRYNFRHYRHEWLLEPKFNAALEKMSNAEDKDFPLVTTITSDSTLLEAFISTIIYDALIQYTPTDKTTVIPYESLPEYSKEASKFIIEYLVVMTSLYDKLDMVEGIRTFIYTIFCIFRIDEDENSPIYEKLEAEFWSKASYIQDLFTDLTEGILNLKNEKHLFVPYNWSVIGDNLILTINKYDITSIYDELEEEE